MQNLQREGVGWVVYSMRLGPARRNCHVNKFYCRLLWLSGVCVTCFGVFYFAGQVWTGAANVSPFDFREENFAQTLHFLQSGLQSAENNDSFRLQDRVRTLWEFCRNLKASGKFVPKRTSSLFRSNPIISTKHGLLYCPAGKLASTSLTRFVIAADTTDPVMNPYDIPVSEAPRERCQSLTHFRREAERAQFVRRAIRMVFVREPYSRVFSAYVDKVFSPNPYYWKSWGRLAQKEARVPRGDIGCGQNVTFAQFVRHVTSTLHRSDVHHRPVTAECSPCHVGYGVIGHLETFREDVLALAGLLNLSTVTLRAADFQEDSARDAIEDSTQSSFRWKSDVLKCITPSEMGRRLWRKMQIRGIVSFRIDYPFSDGDLVAMTSDGFKDAVLEARRRSLTSFPEKLRLQKVTALADAYSTVPEADVEKLAKVYAADFDAFGYERKPRWLSERRTSNRQSEVFNVLKTWTL